MSDDTVQVLTDEEKEELRRWLTRHALPNLFRIGLKNPDNLYEVGLQVVADYYLTLSPSH